MTDPARVVVIRSFEPSDAPALSALIGSPGVFEGTLQLPDMPVSSRVEAMQKNDPLACRLVALNGDAVIGMAALFPVHPGLRRSHVRLLAIAIAADWQGRGIGRQLMERLLAWADDWGNVLRIELNVHADNERAIALYRSMRFEEEGRHRGYVLKAGKYTDALTMSRWHPDPPRLAS